jgi:hypothetical protein
MHERNKLNEATYFHRRMADERLSGDPFLYNLSAFLSASRSVLQYAHREANTKKGGSKWYSSQIQARPVLQFFRDKRDVNIHQEPVVPTKHAYVKVPATLHLSGSLEVRQFDSNGILWETRRLEGVPRSPVESAPVEVAVAYTKFSDWSGPEDLMELCQKYLDELGSLVEDGISRGFLSG